MSSILRVHKQKLMGFYSLHEDKMLVLCGIKLSITTFYSIELFYETPVDIMLLLAMEGNSVETNNQFVQLYL